MVALQILVLSVQVRILVSQQKPSKLKNIKDLDGFSIKNGSETGQAREDHTSNQLFSLYDTLKELCKEKMHFLTSAQANHVTRSERHALCACLDFSLDMCADNHHSTLWVASSLPTSLRMSGRSRTGQGLNIVGTYKSLIISAMKLKQMDSPLKKNR